jgi:hypothetical protein
MTWLVIGFGVTLSFVIHVSMAQRTAHDRVPVTVELSPFNVQRWGLSADSVILFTLDRMHEQTA